MPFLELTGDACRVKLDCEPPPPSSVSALIILAASPPTTTPKWEKTTALGSYPDSFSSDSDHLNLKLDENEAGMTVLVLQDRSPP
ncbi:MAG: hypothetical protein KIH01_09105 [Candidatus Freyarchaeota archaeon]|nr:hypothetical protein [Candidatus Jordarchaeia archaeon]